MLSLSMSCHYHRLKLVVMFGTKKGNERKFIIGCFILYQKKKKNLTLITFNFAPPTNPRLILVLEMINILYVE